MDRWLEQLSDNHPDRDGALEQLRGILFRGLQNGLSGRAATDEALLQDIVQDAILRILDRLHTFNGRSHFTSWALAIAFRVAFNELRRREWKTVSLEELRNRQDVIAGQADPSAGPDDFAERRDLARFIREVVQSDLTSRQRDVLLCELSGMPQEEIARQLGTNRNNVYKLFHDARKALKRALEARGHNRQTLLGTGHDTSTARSEQ